MKTTGSRNLSPEHRCSISQPITTGSGGCSLIPMLALCPGFAKISRKLNPTPANPRMSAVVYQESRGLQQLSGNLRCGRCRVTRSQPRPAIVLEMPSAVLWARRCQLSHAIRETWSEEMGEGPRHWLRQSWLLRRLRRRGAMSSRCEGRGPAAPRTPVFIRRAPDI